MDTLVFHICADNLSLLAVFLTYDMNCVASMSVCSFLENLLDQIEQNLDHILIPYTVEICIWVQLF